MLLRLLPLVWLLPPVPGPPPAFYTTYSCTAYTVYDFTTSEPPTKVSGVGGTLTLRPDSTYDKHLSLLLSDNEPHDFSQQGRFTTKGDSIFFRFTDKNGADVQRGTFRYVAATGQLSITLAGYPAGNKGEYELVALVPPAPTRPVRRGRAAAGSSQRRVRS